MNTKTATIINMTATDTTRHAHATQISWSQIAFVDSNQFVKEVNPACAYDAHYELCFTSRKISSEQKGLCGIHQRELDDARYYKNVLADRVGSIEDDYIICYDAKVTKQLLSKAGVPAEAFKFICLSSIIKKLYPNFDSYTIPTLIYEFCENTAIDYMPHRYGGRYDVTFMRHIFKHVSLLNGLSTMQDWYELMGETMEKVA